MPWSWKDAFALIDSEAEANFVNQIWVKKNDFLDTGNIPYQVQAMNRHSIKFYSHHILEVQVTDSQAETHARAHAFEAVDLHSYDFLLGYSWLQVVNSDIN